MTEPRNSVSQSLSRPVPQWILVLLVLGTLAYIAFIVIDGKRSSARDERIRKLIPILECKKGDKRALIATAGILAQKTQPDGFRDLVDKTIPEVRGLDEPLAAEWIVSNFNKLHHDEETQTFRTSHATTMRGATTQP